MSKCLMIIPKPLFLLIIITMVWGTFAQNATANVGLDGQYNPTYAQDFAHCPDHFWQGKPPTTPFAGELFSLCYDGFAVLYSGAGKSGLYSAERLTAERLTQAKTLERVDSFRPESRLPTHLQATPKDYQGTGFDKGHLAPNADMPTLTAQYDSFALPNIAPQNSEHNRKLWRHIEQRVRELTLDNGESFVLTGVLYQDKAVAVMNGVFVPSHFYKAVYLKNKNTAIVYYSPNDDSGRYEILSLDEFFAQTGIRPFALPASTPADKSLFAIQLPNFTEPKPAPNGVWGWVQAIIKALIGAIK